MKTSYLTKTRNMLKIRLLFVIPFLSIVVLLFSCKNKTDKRTGEVSIVDITNGKGKEAKINTQKPLDVEVYRTDFMGNGYKVTYFQKEKDSLNRHSATYMTEDMFDKAAYSWLSDTSVSIKLYSTSSKKEKKFKVFGNGPMSGMED